MITYRIYRAAALTLAMLMALGLGACGTTANIIGGCEIPSQYDVVKPGPKDLTKVDPKGHAEEEAAERHEHKVDADDYNAFHDYVAKNCK
jgi:hypothetical protein